MGMFPGDLETAALIVSQGVCDGFMGGRSQWVGQEFNKEP